MKFIEKSLEKLAEIQKNHTLLLLIVFGIITIILGIGIKNVEMQGDISKEMPRHLPIYKLNDKINAMFGGEDTILILIRIDEKLETKNLVKDIRHPDVIDLIVQLENLIKKESSVTSVQSIAPYFSGKEYKTIEDVTNILNKIPGSDSFFSKNYRSTLMIIKADIGKSEEKIKKLTALIEKDIKSVKNVPDVKVSITGNPPIVVMIMDILMKDSVYTLFLAGIIILILLIIIEKSLTKAIVIFMPLLLGLIWTLGTMGWFGIKISIATAGLGAMILGLGVEYGVFMYSRYYEEREKGKSQMESLKISVPGVGQALLGSGLTTIVGFLALTLATFPMVQHLGQSLALGIFYCLISAIVVAPLIIIVEENLEHWIMQRIHDKVSEEKKRLLNKKW